MTDRTSQRDQLIEGAVQRALAALQQRTPAITNTFGLHVLSTLAQQIAAACGDMELLSLMTTADVAAELGISERRVRALAAARNVGWQPGQGVWVFRPADVEALRPGPPGRPRNQPGQAQHAASGLRV